MKRNSFAGALVLVLLMTAGGSGKEFLDTIAQVNIGIVFGAPFGEIPTAESTGFAAYWPSDSYYGKNYYFSGYHSSFGISADIVPMPAIVLGVESHAIKFGIRGGLRFGFLYQNLNIPTANYNTTLPVLSYKQWMVGPVMYYAPVIDMSRITGNYNAKAGFTFFVLFGGLFDTTLQAFPLKTSRGGTVTGTSTTTANGWKMEIGIGGQVSVFAVNLGINVFYSYMNLTLDKAITDYGSAVAMNTVIHEVCLEIYMGIPIEWGTTAVSWPAKN